MQELQTSGKITIYPHMWILFGFQVWNAHIKNKSKSRIIFSNAVVSQYVAWFFDLSINLALSILDTEFFDLSPNLALKLMVVPHTNITLTGTNYCQVVSSKPGARWDFGIHLGVGMGAGEYKRCNSTSSGCHSISWSMQGWNKPVGVDIEVELILLTNEFFVQPAVFVVPLQFSNCLTLYSAVNEKKQFTAFPIPP